MATPIMLNGVTTYDNVRDIDSIVDEMEIGIFVNSARLVDQVMRDARIASTVGTRIGGLLGKPLEFEAAKPSDGRNKSTADKIAEECKTDWAKMFPHAQLVQFIEWGLMHNSGLARIIEDTDPWTMEVWHPWALQWDEYERYYWVQTREEQRLEIRPDGKGGFRDQLGGRWMLFTPWGYGNTRRNFLRCLHRLSNERSWSHRDRARFSEIFGQGIRLGIAPENASDEDIAKYKQKLRLGGEPVIVVRQGPDGKKWGLQIIQSNGTESQLFDTTLTQLDKEIATLFLGQSQTTDGQAGLGANEMAGEPVRLDMMMADNQGVSQTLREQFLMPYYEFTYGKAELAPVPCWRVVPPEDGAKKTLEFKQLMEGIAEALAAGIPIDVRALLEKFGIPALTKEQEAALAAMVAQKQADAAANAVQKQAGKKNGASETPLEQPPSATAA